MRKTVFYSPLLAACAIALSGCGGVADTTINFAQYAGTYSAAYARANGTMTVAVAANGQVSITIVDSDDGTFVGTGSANHVGGFFVTCSGLGGKSVSVNGTLRGSGLGRTAQGTITGTMTVVYNANFLSEPNTTIYANHYEGSYNQGAKGDNWFGDVSSSGVFNGSLILSETSTTVPLTGTVYSNGSFKFTGTGGGTSYTATGNFRLNNPTGILCNGIIKGTTGGVTAEGEFKGHDAVGG